MAEAALYKQIYKTYDYLSSSRLLSIGTTHEPNWYTLAPLNFPPRAIPAWKVEMLSGIRDACSFGITDSEVPN